MTRLAVAGGTTVLNPPASDIPDIRGLKEYNADLLADFDERNTVDSPPRITHVGLVDLLLAGGGAQARPDLVVLAYALPDVHPFVTTSAYLNWKLGNEAASFAVSEQGLLAPFSAVRIASAYGSRSFALAVLEQTALPNDDPLVRDNDLVDSGALLYFGEGRLGVDAVRTADTVRECRDGVEPAASGRTLVVDGPWVRHSLVDGADGYRAPEGTYCTSVWLALADRHADWESRYDTVILHDTDPRSGRCASLVLRSRG